MVLQGSNRPALESTMIHASCVIHLDTQGRELELGSVRAAAGATLRNGARQREACRPLWYQDMCVKGS